VGARVLDAYSGSGALGFEALSRGAVHAVFLESDPRAVETLRRNAAALGLGERCRLVAGPVVASLRAGRAEGPFDVILADPPYAGGEAPVFLPLAAARLAPGGVLVLERDAQSELREEIAGDTTHFRTARYGRCFLDWYRRAPEAGHG
jgi:16S rRNA (guanine(966)-N(2))-methyltransferase RsmD